MKNTDSPWGNIDDIEVLEKGITRVWTAGHGGIKLDAAHNAKIPKFVQEGSFNKNGLRGWYEEDCDWAIVAYAFPHLFSEDTLDAAHKTLLQFHKEIFTRWEAQELARIGDAA